MATYKGESKCGLIHETQSLPNIIAPPFPDDTHATTPILTSGSTMAMIIYHLKASDFILTKLSGDLNDENLRQMVLILNQATEELSEFRGLADLREITSLKQWTALGATHSSGLETSKPKSLLAILVSKTDLELYGLSRAYQMFSLDIRTSVKLFTAMDKALEWISHDAQDLTALQKCVKIST